MCFTEGMVCKSNKRKVLFHFILFFWKKGKCFVRKVGKSKTYPARTSKFFRTTLRKLPAPIFDPSLLKGVCQWMKLRPCCCWLESVLRIWHRLSVRERSNQVKERDLCASGESNLTVGLASQNRFYLLEECYPFTL